MLLSNPFRFRFFSYSPTLFCPSTPHSYTLSITNTLLINHSHLQPFNANCSQSRITPSLHFPIPFHTTVRLHSAIINLQFCNHPPSTTKHAPSSSKPPAIPSRIHNHPLESILQQPSLECTPHAPYSTRIHPKRSTISFPLHTNPHPKSRSLITIGMETNYRQFQSSPHALHFTSTIHPAYSCPPYPSRTATIHSSIHPLFHSITHPLLIQSTNPLTQTHLLPNYQLYTPSLHSIQFTSPSLHPFNIPLHIRKRSLSIRSSPPASPSPNRHPSIHYPNNPMHLLAILFKYPYEGLQHFSPYAKLIFHQHPIFEPHNGHTPTIP